MRLLHTLSRHSRLSLVCLTMEAQRFKFSTCRVLLRVLPKVKVEVDRSFLLLKYVNSFLTPRGVGVSANGL